MTRFPCIPLQNRQWSVIASREKMSKRLDQTPPHSVTHAKVLKIRRYLIPRAGVNGLRYSPGGRAMVLYYWSKKSINFEGVNMNWDQVEGKWKQVKGTAKAKWGKLTDDDLEVIAGDRERLAGKLQERYGIVKEEAEKQIDQWLERVVDQSGRAHSVGG